MHSATYCFMIYETGKWSIFMYNIAQKNDQINLVNMESRHCLVCKINTPISFYYLLFSFGYGLPSLVTWSLRIISWILCFSEWSFNFIVRSLNLVKMSYFWLRALIIWFSALFIVICLYSIGDEPFRDCSLMEGKGALPKICQTYPTIIRLDTLITYLKKI